MINENLQDLLLSQEPRLHKGNTVLKSLRGAHRGASRGTIPTLPQLIISKINNPDPENKLWTTAIDTLTSEYVFPDKDGKFCAPGEYLLMTFHGEGIATQRRIHYAMQIQKQGAQYMKLEEEDYHTLLDGVLPSGQEFPIYTLDDISSGKIDIYKPHAIVQPRDRVISNITIYSDSSDMLNNPVQLARISGAERYFKEYFELAKDYDGEIKCSRLCTQLIYEHPNSRFLRVERHRTGFTPIGLYHEAIFSSVNPSKRRPKDRKSKTAE